jgi:hypothetical protein
VSAAVLDEESVFKALGIRPPYTAQQIMDIESVKKPHVTDYNRHNKVCSFCLRPEASNPLSQFDKFVFLLAFF